MKKNILKVFLLALCFFATSMHVNAGTYKIYHTSYCFYSDGSYGTTVSAMNTNCPGYYSGTVFKQIDGVDAYCTQNNVAMSTSGACTAAQYNQFGWMNGNWTEANAVKLGYAIQYVKSKGYGHDKEYVYLVNIANQMLQFQGSAEKRALNSDIQAAINYANTKYSQYLSAKNVNKSAISGSLGNTLVDAGNFSKGEIKLTLTNPNPLSNMTVTASCGNCKVYTDSSFTTQFSNITITASQSKSLTLYVKTDGALAGGTKVSVSFKGTFADVTYPIAKVWTCGSTSSQSLATLSSGKLQFSADALTLSSVVPEKKICKVEGNDYYGKDGKKVTEQEYKDQCLKICKVEGNDYYGKDGKKVTEQEYKDQCLKVCKVEGNNYYGKDGKKVTEQEYKDQCLKVCKVEGNNYYGKDGKKVTEQEYKDQCLKICKVEGNNYYGKDGKKVTEQEYKDQCLKICKVDGNNYYGKDGKKVTEQEYKDQCLKICKVDGNNYYGKDGKKVTEQEYKDQCLKICKVDGNNYYGKDGSIITEQQYRIECGPAITVIVPSTGSNGSAVPMVIGSLFVALGLGSIKLSKKKYASKH